MNLTLCDLERIKVNSQIWSEPLLLPSPLASFNPSPPSLERDTPRSSPWPPLPHSPLPLLQKSTSVSLKRWTSPTHSPQPLPRSRSRSSRLRTSRGSRSSRLSTPSCSITSTDLQSVDSMIQRWDLWTRETCESNQSKSARGGGRERTKRSSELVEPEVERLDGFEALHRELEWKELI